MGGAETMNSAKLFRVILGSLIVSTFLADASAQHAQRAQWAQSLGCSTPFRLCPGCDTFTTITVQTGKVCLIRLGNMDYHDSSRQTALAPTATFGQKVVVRPRGGMYGTTSPILGAYKPNPGFVGSDSFQVDIEFERQGQRSVTHLKANVNVLP
jgi:hypothetical protein